MKKLRFQQLATLITCILAFPFIHEALGQVNLAVVQIIEPSEVLTSTVPVKLEFDSAGNLYMTGQRVDGCLVVAKYATNGSEIWANTYCGSGSPNDRPIALVIDTAGNCYVAAVSHASNDDYATLKFDAAGNSAWTNRLNGAGDGDDTPGAMAVDAEGNVYVTGRTFISSTVIIQGTVVTHAITTISYSASGAQRWRNDYQPALNRRQADAIAVDNRGRVFVSGISVFFADPRAPADEFVVLSFASSNGASSAIYTRDSANGGGAGAQTMLATTQTGNLVFMGRRSVIGQPLFRLIEFDGDLAPVWTNTLGPTTASDSASGATRLGIDSVGNVYAAGYFTDPSFAFPTNGNNYQLGKFDASGGLLWRARYDGPAFRSDMATDLLVDGAGNTYITGTSPGVSNVVEWATLKYLPDGTNAWVARFGGYTNANFQPLRMRLDAQEHLFVAGSSPGQSGVGTALLMVKYTQHGARISRISKDTVHMEFVGMPRATNRLQRADSLPIWNDVAVIVADDEGLIQYDVTIPSGSGQNFFRTRSP